MAILQMDHILLCFLWFLCEILEASSMYQMIYLFYYFPVINLDNLKNHLKMEIYLLIKLTIIFLRNQMIDLYFLSKNQKQINKPI